MSQAGDTQRTRSTEWSFGRGLVDDAHDKIAAPDGGSRALGGYGWCY